MPSRYVVRDFAENNVYHVFNRGVEKRTIFLDEQDYRIFLYYLFIYLAPLEKVLTRYPILPLRLHSKNLAKEIDFFCYCLMPNHFHFLIRQITKNGISKLIKQLTNAYTLYFNQKYKRVGGLLQGRFKAVGVKTDNLLLHVSRYIHLNPVVGELVTNPEEYPWSSYPAYINNLKETICNRELILSFFSSSKDYEKFVQDQVDYANNLALLKDFTLDG